MILISIGELDATPFGTFVVKNIDWDGGKAETGFCLLDAWQGRGLGSALVYKCIAKLFAEAILDHTWATVSVTNAAGNRLMQRLGFDDGGICKEVFLIQGEPVRQRVYRMSRDQARAL